LYAVKTRLGVPYVEHDGVTLKGDFYRPKGVSTPPVIVAVHGGAWQTGSCSRYQFWGEYLAKRGYAVFAVEYRLPKPTTVTFPHAVCDLRSAVQFIRARAREFGTDPDRVAMMGDSAAAHLSSMVALAWNEPLFSAQYRSDTHAATAAHVKAVIGFYGVYDLLAQWEHDQTTGSGDQFTENFLGTAPRHNRRIFFEASPISYATTYRNSTRFLLIDGTHDDIVDAKTQGAAFLSALKNANFFARTIAVPGAGHFWATDPIEETGSFCGMVAPRILRFLDEHLSRATHG
jgi:acetyl esterase/lipase